ncbi:MAG: hypothetical protein AAF581_00565 [Planctomycetota bacterium]
MSTIGNTLLLIATPVILLFAPALATRGPMPQVLATLLAPIRRLRKKSGLTPTGYVPLLRATAPATPKQDLAFQGLYGFLLAGSAIGIAALTADRPLAVGADTTRLVIGLTVGTLLGGAAMYLIEHVRSAVVALRCARQLAACGVAGTWVAGPLTSRRELPFEDALIRATTEAQTLDVIDTDALSTLASLSHPAHGLLEAPHPALHGTKLRLLVTPLRCSKIDPERKRSSCAEEALSRVAVPPEQQWQRLQQLQQIQQRWRAEFSTDVEVRFVEDRPCTHLVLTENEAWFRPWVSDGNLWTEVDACHDGNLGSLHAILRDAFLSAWADAQAEPVHNPPAQGSSFAYKKQPQQPVATLQIVG